MAIMGRNAMRAQSAMQKRVVAVCVFLSMGVGLLSFE